MTEVLVRNAAKVATGDSRRPLIDAPTDIRIVDGFIAAIGPAASGRADRVLDATGMLVTPGLWDAHHHPFFGDHTPQFDARGYLAETVRAGTTTVVSAGTIDFPGRPRDAAGERELAILAQRSWIHDRPLEINVLSDTAVAAAGLEESDFVTLGRVGVRRLVVSTPLPTEAEARRIVGWARIHGLKVIAHADGPVPLVRGASVVEALGIIEPDIVLGVNGGDIALAADVIDQLVSGSRAVLEVSLTGNLQVARRLVASLVARAESERVILGTETPSARGVIPSGIQRMMQLVVGATPAVTPALTIALASGNTARAYGLTGGVVEIGMPADLLLCGARQGSAALDDLARGEWLDIRAVLIAGSVESGGATATAPAPALAGIAR